MSRKTLEEYVGDLHSEDENVRRTAAMRLMNFEDPLAIQALKGSLTDTSASVRFYAKKSLAKLEKSLGEEEVSRHIPVEEEERALLAQVFASLETKDMETLLPLITHAKGLVRASAIAVLGRIGTAQMDCGGIPVEKRLLDALQDDHGRVVANAIEAMQMLEIRPPDELTMKLLFHDDPRVKANMAIALFHFHSDRPDLQQMALARLREAIENEKPWVRQSGVFALKSIGTQEARELLQSLLTDREKIVREQAEEALKELNSKPSRVPPATVKKAAGGDVGKTVPADEPEVKKQTSSIRSTSVGIPTVMVSVPAQAGDHEEWKERAKLAGIGCGALIGLMLVLAVVQGVWEGFFPGPPVMNADQKTTAANVKNPVKRPVHQGAAGTNEIQVSPEEQQAMEAVGEFSEGVDLLYKLDFDSGIQHLEDALGKAPDNEGIKALLAAAWVEKGRYQSEKGDRDAALQSLDKAHEYMEIVAERVLRSQLYRQEKKYPEAITEAEAAVALDATNAPGYEALALSHQAVGEMKTAAEAAGKAVELDRTNWRYSLLRGQLLSAAGDHQAAVEILSKTCLLRPVPEVYQELVRVAETADRPIIAIQGFQQMLRITPRDPQIRQTFAEFLMKNGMHIPAIEQWKALMRVKPGDSHALYQIALCFQSSGDATRMKKFMEMALRAKPDFFEPHYSLGALLTVTGQAALAEDYLRKAVKLRPDSTQAQMLLATALMDQRKFRPAEKLLSAHLKKHPDDLDAHLVIAQAYSALTEPDRAREHFKKFLELEPVDSKRRKEVEDFMNKFQK